MQRFPGAKDTAPHEGQHVIGRGLHEHIAACVSVLQSGISLDRIGMTCILKHTCNEH